MGELLRSRGIMQRENGNRIGSCGYLFAAGRTMVGARFIVHSALEGAAKPRPYLRPPCGGPNPTSGFRFPFELLYLGRAYPTRADAMSSHPYPNKKDGSESRPYLTPIL